MPELPDILLYLHALRPRVVGQQVQRIRLASPFLLRSVEPPLTAIDGRAIVNLHRLGKRVVFEAEGELFLVFHLMIAGRFRWKPPGAPVPGKVGLLAIDFEHGTLVMTEAGTKRRASLYVVQGREALEDHNRGGLEVMEASLPSFAQALARENHTLKRALTDPHLFSGIGNAYSDEILHAARLSPFKQTASLTDEEIRGCTRRRVRRSGSGPRGCNRKPETSSPRRSRLFARAWPCTAATASRVPSAALRFNGSSTLPTKPTTASPVRPEVACLRTGRCRGCCGRTGPGLSTSSNVAEKGGSSVAADERRITYWELGVGLWELTRPHAFVP